MHIKLTTPEEPQEVKKFMMSLETTGFNGPDIEWDPLIVWYGNRLPKYLWDQWKDKLKPAGFTWQKFMRLLHYRTDISVLWYKGKLPWQEFVKGIKDLIEGPIGEGLVASQKPR